MFADEMPVYRVEQAKSDRSTCTVSKEKIEKDELRFGSLIKIGGKGSYKWRKLGCITPKQVANVEETMGGPDKVGGFDDLDPDEQARFREAFAAAAVAPPPAAALKKAAGADPAASPPAKKAKSAAGAAAPGKKAAGGMPVEPVPTLTAGVVTAAHAAIDLAKHGKWKELFLQLDGQRELINVRPDVRDFGILHQAAFLGAAEIVTVLLETYGADPKQPTKHGQHAANLAKEQGHLKVAEQLAKHKPAKVAAPKVAAATAALTPEKVPKAGGGGASPSSVAPVVPVWGGSPSSSSKEKVPKASSGGASSSSAAPAWGVSSPGSGKDPASASGSTAFPAKCKIAVVPAPSPLSSSAVTSTHELLDLAKEGKWSQVFSVLDERPELVNARPAVREFCLLHQAAFLDEPGASQRLLEVYGADPSVRSKSGSLPLEVAEEEGNKDVTRAIRRFLLQRRGLLADSGGGAGCASGGGAASSSFSCAGGKTNAAPTAVAADHGSDEGGGGDMDLVQMPDGSWKVMFVGGAKQPEKSTASTSTPSTGWPAGSAASSSSPAAAIPQAAAAGAAAPSTATASAAVDEGFPDACGEWRVFVFLGDTWSCRLKAGAKQCILQLLHTGGAEDRFVVFSRWGARGEAGTQQETQHCPSLDFAAEAFKAKFYEKTGNQWEGRANFKAIFGKFVMAEQEAPLRPEDGAASSSCSAVKASPQQMLADAHKLIDLAKANRWADVFKVLNRQPELMNVRPEVREFAVLHQAAFYGKADVVATLVEKHGADPMQLTKSGLSAAQVAQEQGHAELAAAMD